MEDNMKIKSFWYLIIAATALALAGCGGGGGGGTTAPAVSYSVSGVASAGLIKNGTVNVYALNADGSKGSLLKTTTTDNTGYYSANVGGYTGPVLVEAYGSYTDEATGTTMTIPSTSPLRAAPARRPATSVAVPYRCGGGRTLTAANIAAANTLVTDMFKSISSLDAGRCHVARSATGREDCTWPGGTPDGQYKRNDAAGIGSLTTDII
jgi:hypothetical protein